MTGFLLRRLAASLLLLVLVLSAVFFLIHLAPGDPTQILEDPRISAAQRAHLRQVFGLDRPLPEQYAAWLYAVAVRGDWGLSFAQRRPVTTLLREALPATALLGTTALVVDFGLGTLLGVAAARRRGSAFDHLIRIVSLVLYSQPVFWLGLMAILLFSHAWHLLPSSHMHAVGAERMGAAESFFDLVRHLLLPALVLGVPMAGATARFVRASLLEVMGRDYIRAARAKGLSERRVVWVHGLRNALVPVIQVFALTIPLLLAGSLITEVVFAWPGLGRATFDAILARDYPVILAITALTAMVVIASNFMADVLHAAVDPRVREPSQGGRTA